MTTETAWAFFEKWAKDQGLNHNTWLSWRKRGIPHWARLPILEAAKGKRLKLDPGAFDQPPANGG